MWVQKRFASAVTLVTSAPVAVYKWWKQLSLKQLQSKPLAEGYNTFLMYCEK